MRKNTPNSKLTCIIDDDHLFVNLVQKLITVKEFTENVIVFKDGSEAIAYFRKNNCIPDTILVDLNMPVMDGWEFVNQFSALQKKLATPTKLYIISASEDPQDLEKAKNMACVNDFIAKPITIPVFDQIYRVA